MLSVEAVISAVFCLHRILVCGSLTTAAGFHCPTLDPHLGSRLEFFQNLACMTVIVFFLIVFGLSSGT